MYFSIKLLINYLTNFKHKAFVHFEFSKIRNVRIWLKLLNESHEWVMNNVKNLLKLLNILRMAKFLNESSVLLTSTISKKLIFNFYFQVYFLFWFDQSLLSSLSHKITRIENYWQSGNNNRSEAVTKRHKVRILWGKCRSFGVVPSVLQETGINLTRKSAINRQMGSWSLIKERWVFIYTYIHSFI